MAESNREEIAKLEALYANNPGGRVFTHLAEAYRKAGDLKQAREILEEGLTRHTDYASAYVVLGRVLVDQGAAPEAAAAFRRVLQLDHENRVALRSLGDLARTSDAPAEALTYYHQLQHLDPTDDDLNETIDALTARVNEAPAGVEPVAEEAPAPQPAAPEPIAVAAPEPPPAPEPEPEPMAEPEPWAEPEPMVAEAAAPVESPPPVATTDYGMDWAASDETTEELPGDLAAFVQSQTAQAGPTEELADTLPPFDVGFEEAAAEATAEPMTEPVGEPFGDISLDAPAEEPEAEPAVDFGIGDFAIDPAAEGAETFATEAAAPWTPEDVSDEPLTTEAPEATLEREEAEAPRESSFEELLSSSTSGMSPLAEAGAQEDMPTETLAELYRSQGLADRAAGV